MAVDRPMEGLDDKALFDSATAEPPAPEPSLAPQPEPQPEPAPAPAPEPEPAPVAAEPPESQVPSWRLREETEARRQAEERLRQYEDRLRQIQAQVSPEKPKNFFEDPDGAAQALIMRTLQPYAEANSKAMMAMGKMVAHAVHGADKVSTAEEAFLAALRDQSLDPVDYERVVQSPNRYDEVVRWHENRSVLTSVGKDPQAWFEKQLEAKMADPKFQATMLERFNKSATSRQGTVQLPPSLSRAPAAVASATPEPLGDLSDKSLYDHATRR